MPPSLFTFKNHQIRVVTHENQPWFVAADVCRALGYCMKTDGSVNTSLAVAPLDKAELNTSRVRVGGGRASLVISEPGLYKLIMRSNKPEARAFQDWVTRDVLPAIRKDGGYILGEEKVASGEMSEDELVLKAIQVMQRKIDRLSSENAAMSEELNVLTLDEFRALKHLYLDPQSRSRLAYRAKKIATAQHLDLDVQFRKLVRNGREFDAKLNVYPRAVLEEALKITLLAA